MLTKITSALRSPKPLNHETAWGCLVTNLCVMPGAGTLAAGRRIGLVQLAFGVTGAIVSVIGLIACIWYWTRVKRFPWGATSEDYRDFLPSFLIGLSGVAVFLIGWVWALVTSLGLLRLARKQQPPPRIS